MTNSRYEYHKQYRLKKSSLLVKSRKSSVLTKKREEKSGYILPSVRSKVKIKKDIVFAGIDGEGKTLKDGSHLYTMLCWSINAEPTFKTKGIGWDIIINENGLTLEECLDFILGVPEKIKLVAYAFDYDLTKILESLPNDVIYKICHPGQFVNKTAGWYKGRTYRRKGSLFETGIIHGKTRGIWDVFKFFSCSFVKALENWKILNQNIIDEIKRMKDQRQDFVKTSTIDIEKYCLSECSSLASLMTNLVNSCKDADLDLKGQYHGAGSLGYAVVRKLAAEDNIKEYQRTEKEFPPELKIAIATAYSGGRFENSVVGPIRETIYNYDINSAYPYICVQLPCVSHGKWKLIKNRKLLPSDGVAVVEYILSSPGINYHTWAPFSFRTKTLSMPYPISSGGGWVWLTEYLAGEKYWPNVKFKSAWVFERSCDCPNPLAGISEEYRRRISWGKEGKGLVLKLGTNAIYGKIAQSVGSAPLNHWVWAGMITSGTRAQLIELLQLHDERNVLALATDGLYSLQKLDTPIPIDTGTFDCYNNGKHAPLGGWSCKVIEQGMFFLQCGVNWHLGDVKKDESSAIRSRGISAKLLYEKKEVAEKLWEQRKHLFGYEDITFPIIIPSHFHSMKSSIHRRGIDSLDWEFSRSVDYGTWCQSMKLISFDQSNKRKNRLIDGRLELLEMSNDKAIPYSKAIKKMFIEPEETEDDIEPLTVEQIDLILKQRDAGLV